MDAIEKQLNNPPWNLRYILIVTALVLILFIWSLSAINLENMGQSGLEIAASIIGGILNPDLELLFNFTSQGVMYLLVETMAIAFLGTIIGAILAIPLAFLSASNIVPKPVAGLTRIILIVIRTIPALVYGLMFIRVTGPGPFAGVLTISLISIGMLAKVICRCY